MNDLEKQIKLKTIAQKNQTTSLENVKNCS